MAEKAFRDGHPVTMQALSAATGINRGVLSKIANERGCNTVTDNLDRLCGYFGCRLEQLAEYVAEDDVPSSNSAVAGGGSNKQQRPSRRQAGSKSKRRTDRR